MRMPELSAFEEEARAVEETLTALPDDAWTRPAVGEWAVSQLVAHLVIVVTRLDALLDADEPTDEPALDRVGYYRMGFDDAAIAREAERRAAGAASGSLVEAFADGWRRAAGRAGGEPPDRTVASRHGPMRLDDYLATRVLELVVHHLDLRRATDLPPAATVEAARLAMSLLESLLGGPRPRNLGRTRFLLAATGRIPVDDPRFPILG